MWKFLDELAESDPEGYKRFLEEQMRQAGASGAPAPPVPPGGGAQGKRAPPAPPMGAAFGGASAAGAGAGAKGAPKPPALTVLCQVRPTPWQPSFCP